MGIDTLQDIAFILGTDDDAAAVAREIFAEECNEEIILCLLEMWKAANGPGKSILALQAKHSEPASGTAAPRVITAPASSSMNTLPLVVSNKGATSLLLNSTIAAISERKVLVPITISSSPSSRMTYY